MNSEVVSWENTVILSLFSLIFPQTNHRTLCSGSCSHYSIGWFCSSTSKVRCGQGGFTLTYSDLQSTLLWAFPFGYLKKFGTFVCSTISCFFFQYQLFFFPQISKLLTTVFFQLLEPKIVLFLSLFFLSYPTTNLSAKCVSCTFKKYSETDHFSHLHCQITIIPHQAYFNCLWNWIPASTCSPRVYFELWSERSC